MSDNYTPLHLHSSFSLLDSLCKVDDIVAKLKELGIKSCALTDHGNCWGHVRWQKACEKAGIKPIFGQEFYFVDDRLDKSQRKSFHLILLAETQEGLSNLYKLTTWANIPIEKSGGFFYRPRIDWHLLKKYSKGLICLTACIGGVVPRAMIDDGYERAVERVNQFLKIFDKDHFYLEVQDVNEDDTTYLPEQKVVKKMSRQIAAEMGLKTVATADTHYIDRKDAYCHEILKCIYQKTTLAAPPRGPGEKKGRMVFPGYDYYIKSYQEMLQKFTKEEVDVTNEIADRCNARIPLKQNLMPSFDESKSDEEIYQMLVEKCREGWKEKNINKKNNKKEYEERIKRELADIKEANLQHYFMIVWDVVREANERKIGRNYSRGSAGGCLTSYLLGITTVDPIQYGLQFERFWNKGRKGSLPDIDLDFAIDRRDELIQYLKERFGRDKVFPMVTFNVETTKEVLQDVGRAQCFPFEYINKMTDKVPHTASKKITLDETIEKSDYFHAMAEDGIDDDVRKWEEELKSAEGAAAKKLKEKIVNRKKKLISLFGVAKKIEGCHRHRSRHACALLVSNTNVFGRIPLCYDPSSKTMLTGFDMYDLEEMGFLKLDILGLKTISVLDKIHPDWMSFMGSFDDQKVYSLIGTGNTKGVFQLEKPLGRHWAKLIKPQSIEELGDVISIIRPAVLEAGLAETYVKNRNEGTTSYIHADLEDILAPTYGIMCYQEQLIKIAVKFAGFDLKEADGLRKACIAKGSLVLTDKGPIPIEEIKSGRILSLDENNKTKCIKIKDVWSNGHKPVYKVSTTNGYHVELTEDHEIYTQDGWKQVKDLDKEDFVIIPTRYNYRGDYRKINKNKALILAYFIGEGCYTEKCSPKITNSDKWILNNVKNALEKEFGKNSWREYHQKNGCSDLYFKNKAKKWIEKYYTKCRARNKYLPESLTNIGNTSSKIFVGSYFSGEGDISKNNKRISICSTAFDICAKIQILLLRDGIHSSLEIKNSQYKNKPYKSYTIGISGENFGKFYNTYRDYICPEKLRKIESCLLSPGKYNNSRFMVPKCFMKAAVKCKNINQIIGDLHSSGGSIYNQNITYDRAARINQVIDSDLLENILSAQYKFAKIKSIQYSGIKQVYDFEVEDNIHAGFINGIMVHNCGKKLPKELKKYENKFIDGCIKNKYGKELAEELWRWLKGGSDYLFCKAHAVGYALMAYTTAYYKRYYPTQFFCSMLQLAHNDPKPQEEIRELFYDAQLYKVKINPPRLSRGNEDFELEKNSINYGLGNIKKIGKSSLKKLSALADMRWEEILTLKVKRDVLDSLILSGALDDKGKTRKEMKRQADFINELTKKQTEFFFTWLSDKDEDYVIKYSKSEKRVNCPASVSFDDAVRNMLNFINNKNEEAKILNKKAAPQVKSLCKDYLADLGTEYSIKEKAGYEIYYLGIPATCSEAEVYEDSRKTHTCIQIKKDSDGRKIGTIGIINKVNEKTDRNGNLMAFVGIFDKTYMLDVIFFHDTYAKYKHLLDIGKAIFVEGKKQRGSVIVSRMEELKDE